jgi:hypothetical protein
MDDAGEAMEHWWAIDREILDCLTARRPMSPAEVGGKVGLSEEATASALALLAAQGKVRICLVERRDLFDDRGV